MKDFSSSIDRERLRDAKYKTSAEERMNWLQAAADFVKETRKNWKKPVPGVSTKK